MNTQAIRCCTLALLLTFAVTACSADDEHSNGDRGVNFSVKDKATPADAGFPDYPGEKPYLDGDQSSSAATVGLSTPAFGFKVVAMNLESSDSPERVAAFYKEAMSKYGTVLDCSAADDNKVESDRSDSHDDPLTCDSDDREAKFVYKVGAKKNQRIAVIKPHASGTRFALVHLDMRK